jgi:hypothetical protein
MPRSHLGANLCATGDLRLAQAGLHRPAQRRTSPKRLAIRNIRSGSSARSVGQRPGQRCMRLSSHVLVVVFCGLDLGTRRLLNTLVCDQVIRPVTWRHSKILRVLQQHHSCAMLRCRAGKLATARCCCCRRGAAMTVLVEPFASVYMIEAVSASSWRAGGAASRLTPPTITAWDCFRVRAQGRCRDYHDASVGRPRQARTEPTMTGPRPRCPVAKQP